MSDNHFVVFYSWQNDSSSRCNRNFIESALESAFKAMKKNGDVQWSPRLDKDTAGIPGIPDIANTILEKIRASDAFVADVSFIGKGFEGSNPESQPTDLPDNGANPGANPAKSKREAKILPNPNVMIELGYALAELGFERIVLILNTTTGELDDLPFDLRNRRWPFVYHIAADSNDEDRSKSKKQLASQLQNALEAIATLPPKQKRGTHEQRIQALETMVSTLSGSVAQNSAFNELLRSIKGPVTPPPHDPKALVEKQRGDLIEKVLQGKFEKVTPQEGMFVMSIRPASLASSFIISEDNETIIRRGLRPLNTSSWNHRIYGSRFVTSSGDSNGIDAATELTVQGCINAVGHEVVSISREFWNSSEQKEPPDRLNIPSVAFEKRVIEAAFEYITLLVQLGIKEPWHLAAGIVNMKKSYLFVSQRFMFGGRIFEGGEILPPSIAIGIKEVESVQTAARALRPIFDYIWREHNFPRSLSYAETGDWQGQ